ncbi:hypothetical protein EJB05_39572, partial [Eragrostis curvula]
MAPPPPSSSSLLRDLLAADGFKRNRRDKPPDSNNNSAMAASRAVSMPLQHRRPGKPARSQSDVLTRSRLRNGGVVAGSDDGSGDAGDARRAATATRRSSASLTSARSYSDNKKGSGDSGAGAGARRGSAAAVPALDESALNALISLAAGSVKRFASDEGFRASLRAGCASCLGEPTHRAALDLRVLAQTVERAAREDGLDPRDLKRASAKLHEMASSSSSPPETKDADAEADAGGVPLRPRLAACAHLYMSVVSKLQKRDHSAAVHALEAFCLAPREARTALLPALWDRLLRPGLSHLRTWRDRELAAASSDEKRVKEVEKVFADVLDNGTRVLACYYRDWLLGRTEAMALPDVPAPPPSTVVHHAAGALRSSTSTSYDVGSDVVFSSGSLSPAKAMNDGTARRSDEIEEEEDPVHAKTVHLDSASPECDDGDARSFTPTLPLEENMVVPNKLVKDTSASQVEPTKVPAASTSYPLISDISAIELPTPEFCEGPLQSDTDVHQFSIFATVPSDFLCPLTRQIFNRPVTIETGQTFERHAIVQWLDRGLRVCPVTGQELESLSIPDTNRVLKRLIDNWKSEQCNNLISESSGLEEKLTLAVIDKILSSARDMSEKLDKARHLMTVGGVDFLLRKFQEGEGDEKVRAAEHLLFCIEAEGSCRNYVAVKISGSSILQLLMSEVLSARRTAACLLTEFLCLRRREMFDMLLRGLGTEFIIEAMDVLLEHLRSLPVEEQAPVAVLLLHFDALVEKHSNSTYRDEAARIVTHSLRCCLSDDKVVPNTRKALLLLGGHFSFSGDLLAEDWMLKQAGFMDDARVTPINSDAVIVQDKGAAEHDAWLSTVTTVLLGGNGRRPFLDAMSKCLGSPDADLVTACLTTAGWLTRSLASFDDATGTDAQLAAFSALVPRLKQCLAPSRPARHRVLAAVSLHHFSRIPDCRALLMLLADALRDHLADLAGLTWTARQLSAELHE